MVATPATVIGGAWVWDMLAARDFPVVLKPVWMVEKDASMERGGWEERNSFRLRQYLFWR